MDVRDRPAGFSMERIESRVTTRALLCASCGEQADTVPCGSCGRTPLLGGRYRLERRLPGVSAGLVYAASDLQRAGRPVTVTRMPLHPEWVEPVRTMYPRWLSELNRVDSPHVEAFRDLLMVSTPTEHSLAIVRAPEQTPDLSASLGRPMALHRVLHIVRGLLSALEALHAAHPALSSGPLDRARVGVDASGRVRVFEVADLERYSASPPHRFGEPPELRAGMWRPASDVHRVAALAVCLLSGRAAAHLTDPRGAWDWERHTELQPQLADLFSRWLVRDPDLRPQTAMEARRELDAATHSTTLAPDPPSLESAVRPSRPGAVGIGMELRSAPSSWHTLRRRPSESLPTASLPTTSLPMTTSRSAPAGRRTAPTAVPVDGSGVNPEQRSLLSRALAAMVVLVLALATITALQAALTASGMLPGSPWVGMNTPEEGSP